jgi:thiol-disulfide isomerase/thioredoxin
VRKLSGLLVALVLMTSGCSLNLSGGPRNSTGAGTVRLAPSERKLPLVLHGTTLAGLPLSTNRLDGILVINAWASWCQTCVAEWPTLQEVAASHPHIKFLGLNESDTKASALKFLQDHPTRYGNIFDPHNEVLGSIPSLQSLAIPTTLVLDKQHRIAARIMGQVKADSLNSILDDLSAE